MLSNPGIMNKICSKLFPLYVSFSVNQPITTEKEAQCKCSSVSILERDSTLLDYIFSRKYIQAKSLVGITNDSPLVEADFMTDRDFGRADGNIDMALKDSKESVLELCLLSSAASLFAAARSNLRIKNYHFTIT